MGVVRALQGLQGTIGQPTAQVVGGSLRFKGGQYLERTSTAGNQTTWTWSGWIKTSDLSGNNIFGEDGGYPNASASFNTSGQLRFTAAAADSSVFLNIIPSALFRDLSAWYHFVIVYDSGKSTSSERARIYVNGSRITDLSTATYPSQSATTVVNSNGNAFRIGSHSGVDHLQGYMSDAYLIDGQALSPHFFGFTDPLTNTWRPKKFDAKGTTYNDGTTWSNFATAYATPANAFDGNTSTAALYTVADEFVFTPPKPIRGSSLILYVNTGSGSPIDVSTNGRDFTGVFKLENGAQYSDLYEITDGLLTQLRIKTNAGGGGNIYQIIIDGEVLIDDTTTNLDFGTNGFYLPMDNQDDFEKDRSGKGHIFTKSGFSGTSSDPDVVKDSPSGAVFGNPPTSGITTTSSAPSNYPTFNPLYRHSSTTNTYSDASLVMTAAANNGVSIANMSIPNSGKWYAEITDIDSSSGAFIGGIGDPSQVFSSYLGTTATGWGYQTHASNAGYWNSNSFTTTGAIDGHGSNTVLNVAVDRDHKLLWFGINGVYVNSGNPSAGTGHQYNNLPSTGDLSFGASSAIGKKVGLNCGQKPFKYAPPEGFLPLNSATARPETVITRPDQYVGVTTYTGSGSARSIDIGMKPDLVWFKSRNQGNGHRLVDSVRGVGKALVAQGTDSEKTETTGLTSFDINGYSIGSASDYNASSPSTTYVNWAWKAGGNKNTFNVDDVGYASAAAAGLNGGTATVTGASVGTKQGFSIIKFHTAGTNSGATIPHGLSKSPDFIVAKALNVTLGWKIYHSSLGNDYFLEFDTDAKYNVSNYWGVTSSVFEADASGDLDLGSPGCIAYCWHDVPGLQKFGSFEGNESTDGPFIELGFRPAMVAVKNIDEASNDWKIYDGTRNPHNVVTQVLYPNLANSEDANTGLDFLSNGFKLRDSGSAQNGAETIVYAAWAEAPASNLFGGQSNAR